METSLLGCTVWVSSDPNHKGTKGIEAEIVAVSCHKAGEGVLWSLLVQLQTFDTGQILSRAFNEINFKGLF